MSWSFGRLWSITSAAFVGRVHDRLEREFGSNLLFMDVDAIPLGANFVKVLRDEVPRCDVLLAVIGPNWLDDLKHLQNLKVIPTAHQRHDPASRAIRTGIGNLRIGKRTLITAN